MHYVIIGAGPAGVVAAETLRKADPQGDITLIGDEPERPYSRMAIPYLLIEKVGEEGTHLRHDGDHYQALGIRIVNDRVTAVDTANKRLTLERGGGHNYDKLLIATGSRPVKPPVDGVDQAGVHTCWTLEDARHIIKLAQKDAKVLLIGAGFIGCIVLEALALRGVRLTVVEMGDRMVPRMMNETAGKLIKSWCQSKGIAVHTSTRVTAIQSNSEKPGGFQKLLGAIGLGGAPEPAESRFKVSLDSGQELDADLVISAAGVKPKLEFIEGSGIETDRGILVDHFLQTNIPDVYAAGDVAQGRDFSTGANEVHAIQPTASDHGRISAQNMAGNRTYYQGSINMNVLDTLGLISSSFGLWMGTEDGESVESVEADRYRYISLKFQEDILVGATALGLTQHVGVLRGLIQGRVRLGGWKDKLMQDPNRIVEAYLARNYLARP